MFNLWNPTVLTDGCELDVTRADVFSLHQGSAEFVRACLDAWAITGEIEGWTVEPIRTSYFSDYLDEPDWRDRWQRAWILRVRGRLAAPTEAGRYESRKSVSAFDPGDADGEDGPERCRALVVAGVREAAGVLDAETVPKVIAAAEAHGFSAERIEPSVRQVAPGQRGGVQESIRAWLTRDAFAGSGAASNVMAKMDRAQNPLHQVRLLLAGVDFPKDEAALTALCARLKGDGLFVHRHALEFDALTPLG